ncbi:IQ domain-containing protein K [Nothoprocta perdicaria]|uniref:IQ domain-containing protein K n=1 Tax=Nothoprocta perdicaria TaxID=30464 RepID=UPI000E1C2546|nr:IQ domain-containing protein K [Nothoprocta perdicaria]
MAAARRPSSLWERVCAEYEAEQPTLPDDLYESEEESLLGMEQLYTTSAANAVGQQSLSKCKATTSSEPPDPKTCSPQEYLEYYIFPILLPGMAELLHQAKKEKCFERKRTKFIACDFLTEWLYNKNPKRKDESFTAFSSIPFVSDWLKEHPRPPLPLSLLLSRKEASRIIQSFWRGYLVRRNPEVKLLRQWQKQLREEKNVIQNLKEFWIKQEAKVGSKLEDSEEPTPNHPRSPLVLSPTPQNTEIKD